MIRVEDYTSANDVAADWLIGYSLRSSLSLVVSLTC